MIRINDILDCVVDTHPQADMDIVERAYIYSAQVHAGQLRLSGEPYLSHPLEVAQQAPKTFRRARPVSG